MLLRRESITLDQALAVSRENDRFMERHDGEDKKGISEPLFGEGSRGRAEDAVVHKSEIRSVLQPTTCVLMF